MSAQNRKSSLHRRGQALVLMSLTMLLVAMTVLMTLGISTRAKEKMEAQQVADAAAYSTAVVTSRTMNTIALLNRVHIASMVAVASNQSIISWVGLYRGALNAFRNRTILGMGIVCPIYPACTSSCATLGKLLSTIQSAISDVEGDWDDPDQAAGEQSRDFQGVASVKSYQLETLTSLRDDFVSEQKLTQAIINAATEGDPHGEWAQAQGGDVTINEEQTWFNDNASQSKPQEKDAFFLVPRRESRELAVEATHGSRGYKFVTNRKTGAEWLIAAKLMQELNQPVVAFAPNGEAYWGDEASSGDKNYATYARASNSWDQLNVTMAWTGAPCYPVLVGPNVESSVFSDDLSAGNDEHTWTGGSDPDATQYHTMGDCGSACPGVWTMFIDLNPDQVDRTRRWYTLYGQPKAVVALERDYTKRSTPEPWALNTRFGLNGSEEAFDNRGQSTVQGGLDIGSQYAVGTGLSYYHRPNGHWREPPNFFNPFWRATLVSIGVDNAGHPNPGFLSHRAGAGMSEEKYAKQLTELLNNLPKGSPAAQSVRALADAGFLGWQ